jgi:dihydrofolate reductase
MSNLTTFTFLTLNGFFHGPGGDISWHRHGEEENAYAAAALKSGSMLLFGRVTYQLMASYWPTDQARTNDPTVAEGMNAAQKVVFSRTLRKADWRNTSIASDAAGEVARLKRDGRKAMTVLGSGSIVAELARHGLVDRFLFMIDPVVLGTGGTIFHDLGKKLDLELEESRVFGSGVVLLSYRTA